jgi:hypothetical protein
MKSALRKFAAAAIITAAVCFQIPADIITKAKQLEIGGNFAFENGQFIGSEFNQETDYKGNRVWLNKIYGEICLKAVMNDYLTITLNPEIRLWFDNYAWGIWGNQAFDNLFTQRMDITFREASGVFRLGDSSNLSLLFATGVMPYKYNPDAKNLGEYLFRSGARPLFVHNSFDYAFAKMTGFRIGAKVRSHLSADVFLTEETQNPSFRDWSVSALVNYSLPGIIDAGAGVMLDRIFSVDMSLTQPELTPNSYFTVDKEKRFFRFGGTKTDAYVGIDPKILLPQGARDVFDAQDFRIFTEAAVLGVENTNAYKFDKNPTTGLTDSTLPMVIDSGRNVYTDIMQRIPVMFGMNIPTLKILDYLSVQGEYLPWPYGLTTTGAGGFDIPFPQPSPAQGFNKDEFNHDNWKFSVNLSKTFFNSFSVIGQVARDHTHNDIYAPAKISQNAGQDVFRPLGSYGWWMKFRYYF